MDTTTNSMTVDAARATVSMHLVHLELARSAPDGTYTPVLQVALPMTLAADLANLLAHCVELRDQLRIAAMQREMADADAQPEATQ